MQLIAKFDESNTHAEAPIMTMGGYLGRLRQWNNFDRKWQKELRKAGLDYFHTKEMAGKLSAYPFARKIAQITDDYLLAGFVIRLDKRDYDEIYRNASWGGKVQPDSMYGVCFRFFLSACLEVGVHEYGSDLRLDFVVESGAEHEGAPNAIVRRYKKEPTFKVRNILGTVRAMRKAECYGLQAADALVTSSMWVEKPEGPLEPLIDISGAGTLAQVAQRSLTKVPLFRIHADRSQLAALRDDQFALVEYKRQFGMRRHAEIMARKVSASGPSSDQES